MDVFKIDQSLSAGLGSAPAPDTLTPEVSFDAGSEFNLSFFDGPEENSTQGFSDPGSVGSASASPPPGTPGTIAANPPNTALPIVQVPSGIVIKQARMDRTQWRQRQSTDETRRKRPQFLRYKKRVLSEERNEE